ncbi:hypothetical protein LINPERHAP2_LOCUS22325 [Linum perenne]
MNNSSSNYLISQPSSSSANNNGLIQIHRSQILTHYSHHYLNPSPTTFVQAHTSTLTGSPDTAKHASQEPPPPPTSLRNNNNTNFPIPPIRNIPNRKLQTHQQQSFKLLLDFPKLTLLSHVTPLNQDAFRNNNNNNNGSSPCPSSASSAGNCSSSTAMAATTEEEEERKMQLKSRQ